MQFVIADRPIAKARHRHYTRGSRVITFDPQSKDKMSAKRAIDAMFRNEGGTIYRNEPLFMSLINYTPIPQSWSNKRKSVSENADCISRPDLDNYIKFYGDVLNEIAYEDDRLITRMWSEKLYSSTPRVEITIEPLRSNMIKEHAITLIGEITPEQLNYIVKKANKLGLQKREVTRVYSEEDAEGKHIYFEAQGLKINRLDE